MDKKYALLFAFLITGLIASNVYLLNGMPENNLRENAIVARVIDGDTLVLQDGRHIRLLNINAPEHDIINADQSIKFLKSFENKSISLEIVGLDKYKRTLARLYDNEEYLNLKIVSLGLGSKFLVDENELKKFANAEDEAVNSGKGIWKKSPSFGCFSAKISPREELVSLENSCPSLNTKGFYIKDESRKIYKFDIPYFSEINLHSSNGEDTSTDLFWNSKTDIWNNDRDTLYLFDKEGNIAYHETYGY